MMDAQLFFYKQLCVPVSLCSEYIIYDNDGCAAIFVILNAVKNLITSAYRVFCSRLQILRCPQDDRASMKKQDDRGRMGKEQDGIRQDTLP